MGVKRKRCMQRRQRRRMRPVMNELIEITTGGGPEMFVNQNLALTERGGSLKKRFLDPLILLSG